jgi:predicted ATPase
MVAEVCRSLDGNPLAIELVATRTATYGLSKLLDLLSDQLVLRWKYRRDAAPRHQSVEAMLDWSYDLLTPSEQSVLQRLSVFVGDFSLEAAAAVGGVESTPSYEVSDAIGSLVDKSLINLQAVPGSALLRLRDTTKTYAAMKLHDSGQATDARRRHAEYYLRHLQQYPIEAEATLGNNRGARVNLNLPNVRAALEWAFSLVGDKRLAVEMCTLAVPALADMVSSARIRTAIKNNTDMTKYRI